MMLTIFTCLLISFLLAWFRYRRIAIVFFVLTLVLSIGWFLFHVHSDQYGFRMPWIQTELNIDEKQQG